MQEEITREPFNPACAGVVFYKAVGKVSHSDSQSARSDNGAPEGLPRTKLQKMMFQSKREMKKKKKSTKPETRNYMMSK